MRREVADPSRFRSRRGGVLPLVLLLVLAISSVALSTLMLAHTELLLEKGALDYLESRMGEEAVLDGATAEDDSGVPSARDRPLGGGFTMREAGEESVRNLAVLWRADPDTIARVLPGAVEMSEGATIPVGGLPGVEALSGCSAPVGWPLARLRAGVSGPPADPPLAAPPRVGPLPLAWLLDLPSTEVAPGGPLGGPEDVPFVAEPEGRIGGGQVSGVLLSSGSLLVEGTTVLRGLIMVGGDLRLEGDARLEGVALAGGTVSVGGRASVLGCPAIAAEALMEILPDFPSGVPGGGHLGRF